MSASSPNADYVRLKFANRSEARARLANRYDEQNQLFPVLGAKVSKDLYVRRNLAAAMKLTAGDSE